MDDQWHLMTARPYRKFHHVVDHADHAQICRSEECDTFLPNFTDHVFMPWVTRNFAWSKFAFSQTLKIKLGLIFWHFYFPKFESQNMTLANTLFSLFSVISKISRYGLLTPDSSRATRLISNMSFTQHQNIEARDWMTDLDVHTWLVHHYFWPSTSHFCASW